MTPTKVLVTGAAGFIGSRLMKRLREWVALYDVKGLDIVPGDGIVLGSVLSPGDVMGSMEGAEIVVHLAGPVAESFKKNPTDACDLQLQGTMTVATAAMITGASKLVVASSFYVYDGMPGDYGVVDEKTPIPPETMGLFGASKLMSEVMVREAAEMKPPMTWNALRFGSVYGVGNCSNIVKSIIEAHMEGKSFQVWGKGTRRNQYTHVDDIVEGIVHAMGSPGSGVYNLISPEPTSTLTMARMVSEITHGEVTFDRARPEAPSMPYMHSGKAQRELGWESRPLREGLVQVVREARDAR